MILLSLVGEQPIPNLLPVKHLQPARTVLVCTADTEAVALRLQRMIRHADLLKVAPYDISAVLARLQAAVGDRPEVVVNLTGGTKPMSLAAYALAARRNNPFMYLQSQGHASLLLHYRFGDGLPVVEKRETLPTLITADEYLRAHLPGYRLAGFASEPGGQLTEGGLFEQAVAGALRTRGFEVLAGVRPEGVADQIEIDLVVRWGNQVGIAELKLGDAGGKGPKAGLDQLAMAGGREYLGTYTARFLITGRRLPAAILTLARERNITVIELPAYSVGCRIEPADADRLVNIVGRNLGLEGRTG